MPPAAIAVTRVAANRIRFIAFLLGWFGGYSRSSLVSRSGTKSDRQQAQRDRRLSLFAHFPCNSLARALWKSAAFSASIASLSASFARASQCFCIFSFQVFFTPPFESGWDFA